MHEVLVNRLGGLSLPRKSVVKLTDRPDMTINVYRGRKTTIQQQHPLSMEGVGKGAGEGGRGAKGLLWSDIFDPSSDRLLKRSVVKGIKYGVSDENGLERR